MVMNAISELIGIYSKTKFLPFTSSQEATLLVDRLCWNPQQAIYFYSDMFNTIKFMVCTKKCYPVEV